MLLAGSDVNTDSGAITTVPRSKLGERIGRLLDEDMVRFGRAVFVFFGLAGS